MKFLLLFVFLVLGIVMLLVSLLRGVGQMIFGKQTFGNNAKSNNRKSEFSDKRKDNTTKKVFEKNEGEYVNYEEIKE